MEAGKALEDQFSKLHPSLPLNTRICIVGAGPSGLSAAYALAKLGYCDITVIEKYTTVGGMCESVEIEGKIYDLGGQVLAANSAPVLSHLAKETDSEFEAMDSHKLALIDSSTGRYQDLKVADDYVSVASLTLKLQDKAKESGGIGIHAVSEIASDPTPDFLKRHGLACVPKSVAYGYTASGYGFVQDMPYAYIHEFTRTSMAGKIRRFKGGYMSLWKKLSRSLPMQLLCNTEVLAVERDSNKVRVHAKSVNKEERVMEFDKIIISGAFPFKNGRTYRSSASSTASEVDVMDTNKLEKELFSRVQTIDYYTTVMKIKGFEHMEMGFYYFGEFMEDPTTIGNPVAMQRFYEDTDIFLFWSYGNSGDIGGASVTKLVIDAVKKMGGEVQEVVLQRRFKYFPHISSEDMKDRFYERLECELQGFQNTYYVGGLMAFELTERNSSYSMTLICKHFANDSDSPTFPYVKRLLPVLLNRENSRKPRKLDAIPGLEFPDLSSLDGYLKFWGTYNITQKKILYTWLNDEGNVVNQRSFGDLHANASQIAHKLLTNQKLVIKPGDRVLLVHIPGLDFVDAFFGCLRARVVPVPVLPPDPLQRGGQALLKIENISKSCNAVAILSTVSYHVAVRAGSVRNLISSARNREKSAARWPDIPWFHTDSWTKSSRNTNSLGDVIFQSDPLPEDLCFLQYTSGSTGEAKGVMITHGGLIHNVKMMRKRYKSNSKTVLVSWLPQYHDMGLIGGLFTALVSGGSAILFSPMTFIKNPLLWIQTMSKYSATHSAGPNFAFELVVRRLESSKDKNWKYDLSSMVFLMVAAEPVRQKTLKRFLELSHPFGLSEEVMAPGYGLAENCVYVSCAFGEEKPILIDWQGRVCCGYVNSDCSDVDIRIVNPETSEEIEDGKEGEIWISSPSAGIGYWGMQELSLKIFGNELSNYPGKKFTRTGDLGRILDGNLFITGRIKDLIIVAGRNIYSADVEKTVETSSECIRPGCCAVVGVPEEILSAKGISLPESCDQVGLVVIAEVREGKHVDKEVIEQIQTRIAEEHGVSVASVKLIKPKTICKTTSGKIRRFECLKQFTEGTLNLVTEPAKKKSLIRSFSTGSKFLPLLQEKKTQTLKKEYCPRNPGKSKQAIIEFLRELVSEQTGITIEKISETGSLVSYGIDSIGVVRAAQKLSDFLGVPVGAVDIFTATCIEDLASFSESLIMKSHPNAVPPCLPESEMEIGESSIEISKFQQLGIGLLQFMVLIYASSMLILPAYFSASFFLTTVASANQWLKAPLMEYLIPLVMAPLAWILSIFLTCACISLFGNSFLQPNYALKPEISIWSIDFVKWWGLYKAQEMAGKFLAVHLRGTVFLKYWFEMLGARIGSSVLLDTIDITDPALVWIGDGTVIAEGAMIQSHEVKNGVVSFRPVKIGRNSSIGPYAIIQKGSVVGAEAQVLPLQRTEGEVACFRSDKVQTNKGEELPELEKGTTGFYHLMGIYTVGFLGSLSAAIVYALHIQLSHQNPSPLHLNFFCIAGAFHWFPATIAAYLITFSSPPSNPATFAFSVALAYTTYGIILTLLTSLLAGFLTFRRTHLKNWLLHRITSACHLRFAKLLSGTEAFCVYLRFLGAKIGHHCSIRAVNPITDPSLVSIGDSVHLGDFCKIITGFCSSGGYVSREIQVQRNSIVGSQSLLLPGSVLQEDVVLGALSVAPVDSILQRGGVYMGSQVPVVVNNTLQMIDARIEDMDVKYKKIVGNLAGNLAVTTMKVQSRYFHRIGVGGKGVLKMFDDLPGLPDHKIFRPGRTFPVVIRHSNSLSADDDARIDARGAAIRILRDNSEESPMLDLTLKSGKAFYARTIADFATWLVCGIAAREAHVERAPHVRDAVWDSLRNADSYADLHYYSNFVRLLRCTDGKEFYVKLKLRPADGTIGEDSGKVEPKGILPPETGAIPRDENDSRPLLFLADDFRRRVESSDGIRYILQLQLRPVPDDEAGREKALDCTRPWDENEFPYMNVGQITIDRNLTPEEAEQLQFNPFLRCDEVDVIRATSCTQSASIDHGRSLIYEICQHLRNGVPLPGAWRSFLQQSDVKVDLSGCPMAVASVKPAEITPKVAVSRTWVQSLWATFFQPLLQVGVPYFLLGLAVFAPLKLAFIPLNFPSHCSLPLVLVSSGVLVGFICVLAKWMLVGKRKEGDSVQLWSREVFMDTIWQALRTVAGDFFMEMAGGTVLFCVWMRLMGSEVCWSHGVYVDSMGALLNPEMVEIDSGGCVGREAILFGHIYEGEGGKVKFGKIRVGECGSIGSRAVVMPGVTVEAGSHLCALSLAMKEEIIRTK